MASILSRPQCVNHESLIDLCFVWQMLSMMMKRKCENLGLQDISDRSCIVFCIFLFLTCVCVFFFLVFFTKISLEHKDYINHVEETSTCWQKIQPHLHYFCTEVRLVQMVTHLALSTWLRHEVLGLVNVVKILWFFCIYMFFCQIFPEYLL